MMKRFSLHIFLIALLPSLVMAQENPTKNWVGFYADLAERDAHYEQHLISDNHEDQKDFWKDQTSFEALLAQQNPKGYQIYLKSKGAAYRLHQKECDANCGHSEHYFRKAAFYSVNSIVDTELVFAADIKKPQSND